MRFAHTNIAAENWRSLCDFYINVFDCTVKPPERKLSGDWLDKGTGLENAALEGVHLILPGYGENGPTLEIFTYQQMQKLNPIMANYTGITHIAFEVQNVEQTFDKALSYGAKSLGEIIKWKIDGVGELTFVYFRDPEGNIVEIQSWEK